MCIAGRPSQVFPSLSPREGKLAWRSFGVKEIAHNDGITTSLLEPAFGTGRRAYPRTWFGNVARASGRPTGRRGSDVGLHATSRPVRSGEVVGKVRLFGRVVEHKIDGKVTGYLAEYAEIIGLSVKNSGIREEKLRDLAAAYKVRVLA